MTHSVRRQKTAEKVSLDRRQRNLQADIVATVWSEIKQNNACLDALGKLGQGKRKDLAYRLDLSQLLQDILAGLGIDLDDHHG